MVSINIGPDDIIRWFKSLSAFQEIVAALIIPFC